MPPLSCHYLSSTWNHEIRMSSSLVVEGYYTECANQAMRRTLEASKHKIREVPGAFHVFSPTEQRARDLNVPLPPNLNSPEYAFPPGLKMSAIPGVFSLWKPHFSGL